MLNDEQKRLKEKLLKQVKRYEEKGYKDTSAHVALARLLKAEKSASGESAENAKKAKPEA